MATTKDAAYEAHPSQQALVTKQQAYDLSSSESWEVSQGHVELQPLPNLEDHDVEAQTVGEQDKQQSAEPSPFAVASMPDYIRLSFRRKALGLLCLNLVSILIIASVVRYVEPVWNVFRNYAWFPALAVLFILYGLVCMVLAKDKHPYNLCAFAGFTVSTGLFMGAADKVFESHANFQLMLYITTSVLLMTAMTTTKSGDGEPMPFLRAAMLSWFIVFIAGLILQCTPARFGLPGHFASTMMISLAAVLWFAYDAAKIEARLTPDDFLLAVISFYADLVIVLACYCCAAIFCGDHR